MTRILGSSRSAIVASRRVRRPGNDGRGRRPPGSSCHHLRDERRELPPSRRARTQARPRPAADPRDNRGQYLIVAPRQYNSSIPLARQSRYGNHANIATPDSHPDCRCFPIQIAALQRALPETVERQKLGFFYVRFSFRSTHVAKYVEREATVTVPLSPHLQAEPDVAGFEDICATVVFDRVPVGYECLSGAGFHVRQ